MLQRLLFAYHSTHVSDICHQANPWRGNLLLLNCAVSWIAELPKSPKSHETTDIEAICKAFTKKKTSFITRAEGAES